MQAADDPAERHCGRPSPLRPRDRRNGVCAEGRRDAEGLPSRQSAERFDPRRGDDLDQTYYENFARPAGRNYTSYCNPQIESPFDKQSVESDPAKRLPIVREIDVQLLADGARPPIYWSRSTTRAQPCVKGFTSMVKSAYNGFRFEEVWPDK